MTKDESQAASEVQLRWPTASELLVWWLSHSIEKHSDTILKGYGDPANKQPYAKIEAIRQAISPQEIANYIEAFNCTPLHHIHSMMHEMSQKFQKKFFNPMVDSMEP